MYNITDEESKKCLRHVNVYADKAYRRSGFKRDVSYYQDAGMDAIENCLRNFDVSKNIKFSTYCEKRVAWAMVDADRVWNREHANTLAYVMFLRRRYLNTSFYKYVDEKVEKLPYFIRMCAYIMLCGYSARDVAYFYNTTEHNLLCYFKRVKRQII